MGMKVVIPVAGVGTRLRPHTHTAPKVMVQVAGKPMLGHILDELTRYDVDEVILVIGYLGDAIVDYVQEAYDFNFKFVTQDELKGLGHAIWMTRDAYGEEDKPLLVILGDTIFAADFKTIIGSDQNWIGVKEVEDGRRFGIVRLDDDGNILDMVEKPDNPPTNLAIVGIYYFTHGTMLYECLDALIDSGKTTKGEFQLTDALQAMIEKGAPMRPFIIDGWFDCGKAETLLSTNRDLLAKYHEAGELNEGGDFPNTLLRPPVSIGKGVTIENCIVGPNVTVADGSVIRDSIVTDSIISKNAKVENLLLSQSILADNASVHGTYRHLNVGDASEIRLG